MPHAYHPRYSSHEDKRFTVASVKVETRPIAAGRNAAMECRNNPSNPTPELIKGPCGQLTDFADFLKSSRL